MQMITLVENTAISEDYGTEHGLSLFIDTGRYKLLFDMGASGLYVENAALLGVNIRDVELAVISHGHADHGGGLASFLRMNDKAKVYVNRKAFDPHFRWMSEEEVKPIGLEEALQHHQQIIYVGEEMRINDQLTVFSGTREKLMLPDSNRNLLMKKNGELLEDDFSHEQHLVIEGAVLVLVAGCAHNGIVSILEHFRTRWQRYPDVVIGGFHLYSKTTGESEDPYNVRQIAERLSQTGAVFYTGHCTGAEAYQILKAVMGDQIHYIATGSTIQWSN